MADERKARTSWGMVLLSLCIACIFHSLPVDAQTVPAPPGLVAWWSGEGNANDRLGSSNGTLKPGTSFVAGKVGQAFSLDASHEGVTLGNPAALTLQDLTIEVWVKRAVPAPGIATLDNPGWSGSLLDYGPGGYAFVLLPNGQLGFGKDSINEVPSGSLLAVTDTNWHHVAVTKSGTTLVFYVDGVSKTVLGYTSVFTFGNPVALGTGGASQVQSFYGSIDEMSVYNRALSAAEIQAIIATPSGKGPVFTEVGASAHLAQGGSGYGMAWGDYDGDGDQDIYLAAPNEDNYLYQKNADGTFTDVHTAAGIAANRNASAGVWGDYDNDGDIDLYVAVGTPAAISKLYQNNGSGHFSEALTAGVTNDGGNAEMAAWVDYNNDGNLDLFVVNFNTSERLYRNNGNGSFTDVASTVGLANGVSATYDCTWGDYDNDGDQDVHLGSFSNDLNALFRNDGGTFVDVSTQVHARVTGAVFGGVWGDYDNDGDLDLFLGRETTSTVLLRNDGIGGFTQIVFNGGVSYSGGWGDYDNDGYLDLYSPGRLFHNDQNGTLTAVSIGVFDTGDKDRGGAAWADYDNDGDLDLCDVTHGGKKWLFRNSGTANHWLHVKLVGTVSNKSGIGARVTAVTGSLRRRQDVDGSAGFFGQPSLPVEFGLGSAGVVDQLTINWPSGAVQTLTNVAADQMLTVVETAAYTVSASAGANGSISPSGSVSVNQGGSQAFTVTPNTGFRIADVVVDGSSVGVVPSYIFTGVATNHTISASFAVNTYTITSSAGAGGSISPLGAIPVNSGGSQSFTTTPNAGYHIADVVVDNVSVGAVSSYTFTGVGTDHTISATFAINTYTLTASAGANGSVTPSGATTINYGVNQDIAITPDTGYHIADVLVDGVSVGAVTSHTIDNVTADHTIEASFAINTYTITSSVVGANGSISPSTTVNYGGSSTVTITPDVGYHVADVLVDNASVGAVGTYPFTGIAADHTISASFAINTYTITPLAGSNGNITPSGATLVNYGGTQAFAITPDAGYHIADVLVDGVSVGVVGSYTFTSVTSDHTISASFAINTYTITSSAGAGGSISPSGATTVNYGNNQVFAITPATGYHLADVLVDGISVGAVGSYTFANVTANHTIAASFVDQTPPTLTLNGANPLLLELGTSYPEPGATANDLADGNLTGSIQIIGGVNANAEGSYMLTYTVRDQAGNQASATRTVKVVVTPNSYGLIATHSMHLRQNARINNGFVGVVNRGQSPFLAGKVELVVGTNVQTGQGVRLSAPRVRVRKGATIAGKLVYNELVSVDKRATIADREQVPSNYFPLFQGFGLPAFQSGTPGSRDVEVKQKGTATLSAGSYDQVLVRQKGTLTFTGGTYQLGDLDVGQQAKVIFLAPTTLLIRGQLSLDQKSSFGPSAGIDATKILVYVEGRNGRLGNNHDDDEGDDEEDDSEGRRLRQSPRAVKVGEQASFQGNLYAPNGTLHLRQGSLVVGSFIARDIIVGVRVQVAAQSGWNTPGVVYQPQAPVALKLAGAPGAEAALPTDTELLANYPNPFNPSTAIPYVLAEAGLAKLSIYNVLGQQIRVLVDQLQVPGAYTASWDGLDAAGQQVAGGVYFYRLEAGEQHAVGRMLLLK